MDIVLVIFGVIWLFCAILLYIFYYLIKKESEDFDRLRWGQVREAQRRINKYEIGICCCVFVLVFGIFLLAEKNFGYHVTEETGYQPKVVEQYDIIRGKTEKLIQGDGIGFLTMYNMDISQDNYFSFYFYNEDGDIERKTVDFETVKIREVDQNVARFEVYEQVNTVKKCSEVRGCKVETHKKVYEQEYYLVVPKGTITGSDALVFE